jgi:hypothetical protein
METKRASGLYRGHLIAGTIFVIIFVMLLIMYTSVEGLTLECPISAQEQTEVIPLINLEYDDSWLMTLATENEVEAGPKEEVTVERTELDSYITSYLDDIKFLCYTYSIGYEDFIGNLYDQYNEYHETYGFNENNVGYILNSDGSLKNYANVKYGLVEYINKYIDKNPKKKKTRKVNYTGNSTYVENLIRYYTSIYTNVDTNMALSIGAAESGYYKVKGMLRAGNVYGGMSKGGLIHYDNIEIGVLSYIRLLSKSYFGKGLNTISEIGYRYCPTIDNNGNKIVSPNWMNLVNTAKKKYDKQDRKISASDLLGKIEIL